MCEKNSKEDGHALLMMHMLNGHGL